MFFINIYLWKYFYFFVVKLYYLKEQWVASEFEQLVYKVLLIVVVSYWFFYIN